MGRGWGGGRGGKGEGGGGRRNGGKEGGVRAGRLGENGSYSALWPLSLLGVGLFIPSLCPPYFSLGVVYMRPPLAHVLATATRSVQRESVIVYLRPEMHTYWLQRPGACKEKAPGDPP